MLFPRVQTPESDLSLPLLWTSWALNSKGRSDPGAAVCPFSSLFIFFHPRLFSALLLGVFKESHRPQAGAAPYAFNAK